MKKLFLLLFLTVISCKKLYKNNYVITNDIDNFWIAYDKIKATTDTVAKRKILHEEFYDRASEGQKAMFVVRRCTPDVYLNAIKNYPDFWEAIRNNMPIAKTISEELKKGVEKFKDLYSEARPAKIYFTIGTLRSNGTTKDSLVLIGSELALADETIPVKEIEKDYANLPSFFKTNPKKELVFLNVHEFIHTQQNTTIGSSVLAQSVIEGVAEFLAEITLNKESPNPQIEFGRKNDKRIKEAFQKEMFSPNLGNWVWNNPNSNEFKMNDLAYYIGYRIAKGYYDKIEDKKEAIKEMIQLDYFNEKDVMDFVDASNYFEKPVSQFKAAYNKNRPMVLKIEGLGDDLQNVNPKTKGFKAIFSQEMDRRRISTDLGKLGIEHFPKIEKVFFSEDGRELNYVFKEELKPNKKYELVLHWNMRNKNNEYLIPYILEFKTR